MIALKARRLKRNGLDLREETLTLFVPHSVSTKSASEARNSAARRTRGHSEGALNAIRKGTTGIDIRKILLDTSSSFPHRKPGSSGPDYARSEADP